MELEKKQTAKFLNLKSVVVALFLALILGPIGVLYASVMGGTLLIILGFIVVCSKFTTPIVLLWLICIIFNVAATNKHNAKILKELHSL